MDKRDLRGFDAEEFMGDLGERRLQALSVRVHADPQLEPAIGREAGGRLLVPRHHWDSPAVIDRGAVRTLLAEDREPDAEPLRSVGLRLAPADRVEPYRGNGAAQAFRVIAAVEMLAGNVVEWHRLGGHQIFEAHLMGLAADGAGDRVHNHFDREADPRPRHPAIGQDRRLVRGDGTGPATEFLKTVWAGKDAGDLPRFEAGRKRIG